MRVSPEIIYFLKKGIKEIDPSAILYLFGSRTDDNKRGGDIDLLIISENKLPRDQMANLKAKFYQKFGEQRLDIVNYSKNEERTFKNLIMEEAIKL